MKAIVVTDQAAGMAGMTLVERPEPQAAINDVVVQVHASGFVPTELGWPSTGPIASTVTEHPRSLDTSWPEWSPPSARHEGAVGGTAGVRPHGLVSRRYPARTRPSRHATSRRCRATSTSRWARACRSGLTAWQGLFEHGRLQAGQCASRTARPAQSGRW